ncbi:MAG: hypothetical protein ACE5FC_08465 [Myxococcota bacterium]
MAKSVLGSDPLARVKSRSPRLLKDVSAGGPDDAAPDAAGMPPEILAPSAKKRIDAFERRLRA